MDAGFSSLADDRFAVLYKESNSGPAATRNVGARAARASVLFFTDAECRLDFETLPHVHAHMASESVCMGNTATEVNTFMGHAIGYLGFPSGDLLGFDRVWPVDDAGYTYSITSCNLAVRADVFRQVGGCDESFPVRAGEDAMPARILLEHRVRIRYLPQQLVFHAERGSMTGFMLWQMTHGRGAYQVKRHVGRIGSYVAQRLRSFGSALRQAGSMYGPVVTVLFGLSLLCQLRGFPSEAGRDARRGLEG